MSSGTAGAEDASPRGGAPAPPPSPPDNFSFAARLAGAVRRPRATFARAVRAPRWAGLLVLQFVVYAGASAALFATDVGRQALVDQWERTAIAFGQGVDAARYAELQALSASGPVYGVAMAAVNGPVASFVLAGVLFGVFTGLGRTPARFSQVLSVVAHASVILTLRHLVATPLNYARESITSPATLVGLVSMVDETSPVARFLALIDVFVVWWLIVLAVGLAVLYQRRTVNVAAGLVGAYVVIALALAGAMAALGGASGP